ncbi:MAG: photosystem II complex extrinsic protein PsbU [Spirulina sp. SIO3F2]|nr:photosystem II complex extrinsic protein PsbU [Spirulina sp. SIO3F2]
MKRLIHLALVAVLFVGVCLLNVQPSHAAETKYRNNADAKLETEFGQKFDLNNTNVRQLRKLPGFYPTLAGKIVRVPYYEKVEDVLNIPGLTERQKQLLQDNLDKFTVTTSADVFVQGAERQNNGIYD